MQWLCRFHPSNLKIHPSKRYTYEVQSKVHHSNDPTSVIPFKRIEKERKKEREFERKK